jgi:transcriptional regulator GlxA family with amidase domain
MNVAVIAYDGFTDVDAFLPFDFFHRVTVAYGAGYEGPWRVRLLADRPRITSYSGIAVEAHGGLAEASTADAVFVVSGDGSREKIADAAFMRALQLDPARQVIGAIDSGALVLAALGLLDGLSGTTYPIIMHELEAMGVRAENRALVVHGNVATAGGCLASLDLCAWMVGRLLTEDAAARVRASFEPIGGFSALAGAEPNRAARRGA